MTSSSRTLRLLSLIAFLERRGVEGATIDELAEHFNVTRTQVRKDLVWLWTTGRPPYDFGDLIAFDADVMESEHVQLTDSQSMGKPLRLTEREQISLLLAVQLLQQSARATGDDHAVDLLDGVVEKLTTSVSTAAQAVDVHAIAETDPELTRTLRGAISERRYVALDYINAHGRRSTPVVEAHRLEVGEPSTYVLATLDDHGGEVRRYRLDRITGATVLDATFEPREPEGVSSWLYGDSDPSARAVELVTDTSMQWLGEKHPGGSVTVRDGKAHVSLEVHEDEWLTRLILAHANRIARVEPVQAAQDARERAVRALAAYDRAGLIG